MVFYPKSPETISPIPSEVPPDSKLPGGRFPPRPDQMESTPDLKTPGKTPYWRSKLPFETSPETISPIPSEVPPDSKLPGGRFPPRPDQMESTPDLKTPGKTPYWRSEFPFETLGVKCEAIQNKILGMDREKAVEVELKNKYPEKEGYTILREVYLRDENGNIVKDPETGEARRIDFVVLDKNGNVVDCVEVTSKTADKTSQSAKEQRIRDNGGNYVKLPDGTLAKIPDDVQTRIERRD